MSAYTSLICNLHRLFTTVIEPNFLYEIFDNLSITVERGEIVCEILKEMVTCTDWILKESQVILNDQVYRSTCVVLGTDLFMHF